MHDWAATLDLAYEWRSEQASKGLQSAKVPPANNGTSQAYLLYPKWLELDHGEPATVEIVGGGGLGALPVIRRRPD
jgi:hypothetical protein